MLMAVSVSSLLARGVGIVRLVLFVLFSGFLPNLQSSPVGLVLNLCCIQMCFCLIEAVSIN